MIFEWVIVICKRPVSMTRTNKRDELDNTVKNHSTCSPDGEVAPEGGKIVEAILPIVNSYPDKKSTVPAPLAQFSYQIR